MRHLPDDILEGTGVNTAVKPVEVSHLDAVAADRDAVSLLELLTILVPHYRGRWRAGGLAEEVDRVPLFSND